MQSKRILEIGARFSLAAVLTFAGAAGTAIADGDHGHAHAQTITVKPTGGDFASIQDAIDAAAPGDTIQVYPGGYFEVAAERTVLAGLSGESGPYQFGLFIGHDRDGLTIQGVDAKGRVIKDWSKVKASVTTDATNDFGPSGIFVEGDDVTISGLDIGKNLSEQNKTIEVSGDGFTLLDCDVSDVYGSIYFDDWRFDEANDRSHLRSYTIEGNRFQDGVSLDFANGAGYSGKVERRSIRHNAFENSGWWPSISFNGSGTWIPWFEFGVGGAVIKSNTFENTFEPSEPQDLDTEGHIRARGVYDNAQFDWKSYWNENKYNRAFVVGPKPAKELRAYDYGEYDGAELLGTFHNVRRIGALLEGEERHQEPGDKILSK